MKSPINSQKFFDKFEDLLDLEEAKPRRSRHSAVLSGILGVHWMLHSTMWLQMAFDFVSEEFGKILVWAGLGRCYNRHKYMQVPVETLL